MSIMRDNQLAKRNVAVLICAQAILGAQMPMIFTVGGLAGQSLASNACFATMPISMSIGLYDNSFSSLKLNAKIWKTIWRKHPFNHRRENLCQNWRENLCKN